MRKIATAMIAGTALAMAFAFAVAAAPPVMVTICHAAGLADEPANWVTLTLPEQVVYGQAGHFYENGTPQAGHEQDYLGACRIEASPTPTVSPSASPTPTVEESISPSVSIAPSPSSSIDVPVTKAPEPIPNTALELAPESPIEWIGWLLILFCGAYTVVSATIPLRRR